MDYRILWILRHDATCTLARQLAEPRQLPLAQHTRLATCTLARRLAANPEVRA
jgi:hypothetical protein